MTCETRPDSVLLRAASDVLLEHKRGAGDEGVVVLTPTVAGLLADALGTASVLAEAREVEAAEASMRAESWIPPAQHPVVARLAKLADVLAPPVAQPPF